jgi:glycosyltransferase involved in cell wall biosynthesis
LNYPFHTLTLNQGTIRKEKPAPPVIRHDTALVVHLFYPDVWEEIAAYLQQLPKHYDLYITVPETLPDHHLEELLKRMPEASFFMVENRGRDVLPFLLLLKHIGTQSYRYLCKLHTKKSVTSHSGNAWRKLLYYDLIGSPKIVSDIRTLFEENPSTGMITGKNLVLDAKRFDLGNSEKVRDLAALTGMPFTMDYTFAAGTMFWVRPSIFVPLIPHIGTNKLLFEEEMGQSDHTLAHALERFFGLLCKLQHYTIEESPSDYRHLDKETLEALAVLAFTQRFDYDMALHHKDLLIHERDKSIHTLLTSKSYRYTKPFRDLEFLIKTLMHFKLEKIKSHGTDEHKLAMAIKRRIPQKLFYLIKTVLQRKMYNRPKDLFWAHPLTNISANKGRRVVIIAELSIPQCTKYRVEQKAQMLALLGYDSDIVSWTEYEKARNLIQLSALVFFYRVPAEPTVLTLMQECKRVGVTTLFDVDDLIFDEALLKENINIQRLPKKIQEQVFTGARTYAKAMRSTDLCCASTPVLAKEMEKASGHKSHIIPNALDNEILRIADSMPRREHTSEHVTIFYGSGTSTHDIDFLECAPALLSILKEHPHVRFVIHGTLTLPDTFKTVSSQIKEIPFMESSEYYRAISRYDISISPLEPTLFNDAKSNIKFIEASMFKLPTIASPAAEYKAVIEHKKNGLLASGTEAWREAFNYLISDASRREAIAEAAYRTTIETYAPKIVAERFMHPLLQQYIPLPKQSQTKVLMANILYKPTSYGGATVVVEELSRRLNEKEAFDVTIVTAFFDMDRALPSDYDIVRYESNGVPVILIRLPEPMLPLMEYRNERMGEVFDSILESLSPDIVHFHSIQQLSASIIDPCIQKQIPYVITLHDMWWLCQKQFMIMPDGAFCNQTKIDIGFCQAHCGTENPHFTQERAAYLPSYLEHADLLLTPSAYQKEIYSHNIRHTERLKINKNGILFPAPSYQKVSNTKIRFAYVGGNAAHKGYPFLKEIFSQLDEEAYELVLVDLGKKLGYPTIFASDWQIKGELTLSDGYVNTQEGLDTFYRDIDVLLFPSQCKESFGLTVREALVRDVWVISTDAGGVVEDISEGVNGNIVAMQDHHTFKERITERIRTFSPDTHYTNPEKEKIRDYETQTDELAEYYYSILKKRVNA